VAPGESGGILRFGTAVEGRWGTTRDKPFGLQYRTYKTNEPTDMERTLLFEADLEDARNEPRAKEVAKLLSYLSRESIESGRRRSRYPTCLN
jgi:hypothetical protein